MSFTVEKLEEGVDFADAVSTPEWIVGEGKKIYWRNCFIAVFTTGNVVQVKQHHDKCDGQGIVEKGTEVYVGGNGGKVKIP